MRFGAVHGGKNTALLSRSLEQIILHDVEGLVVCDVCEEETVEEREEIYRQIGERVKQSSREYKMCLAGMGRIEDIEHARKFGYGYFEVNYPFVLAQKHVLLIKEGDRYV